MLPKWLRLAVKDQVLSQAEAQEIHRLSEALQEDEVVLPEHLHPAAERIHLWEMPVSETLH